ncbi:hypothetical protein ACFLZZ_00405 [Nanoarchaeota archaeon]
MVKPIRFVGKAVKQGNSLCIRIPFTKARKLKIKENTPLLLEVMNLETLEIQEDVLKAYQSVPELKKYTLKEIRKYVISMNLEKTSRKKTIKDKEYIKFRKLVKKNKTQIKKNLLKTKSYKSFKKKL